MDECRHLHGIRRTQLAHHTREKRGDLEDQVDVELGLHLLHRHLESLEMQYVRERHVALETTLQEGHVAAVVAEARVPP